MKLQLSQHQELSVTDLYEEYFKKYYPSLNIEISVSESLYEIIRLLYKKHGKSFIDKSNNALSYAYDTKYGNWDNVNDLRKLYGSNWCAPVKKYFEHIGFSDKLIDVGCNDGRELKDLLNPNFDHPQITLIDISKSAIRKLQHSIEHRHIELINQSFLEERFKANSFDFCVSLRTLHSSGMDTNESLSKCYKITKPKGLILLSVSNGYIDELSGEPLKGMYDYSTRLVDETKPYEIAGRMASQLKELKANEVQIIEGDSEIFVAAYKSAK